MSDEAVRLNNVCTVFNFMTQNLEKLVTLYLV